MFVTSSCSRTGRRHGSVVRMSVFGWWNLPDLSLIYGLTCDHFVGKVSAIGQPIRPLNGRPGLHMAVWLQVKVRERGLSLQPIDCMPALSGHKKCLCSCGA